MKLKNNEMIDARIKASGDDVKIPEGLKPEWVEDKSNQVEKKKRNNWKMPASLVAACLLCVVVAGVWKVTQNTEGDSAGGKDRAVATSYEQIYKMVVKKPEKKSGFGVLYDSVVESADVKSVAGGMEQSNAVTTTSGSEVSSTNIQVEGVDEGDIVKADEKYIYIAKYEESGRIEVVERKGESISGAGVIVTGMEEISEMYLTEDRLTVVGSQYGAYEDGMQEIKVKVKIYDVKNPARAREISANTQSGSHLSSRYVDGYLYLFTYMSLFSVDTDSVKEKDTKKYIPCQNGKEFLADDICVPQRSKKGDGYLVMSSIHVNGDGAFKSRKAFITTGYGEPIFYVSKEYIYIAETEDDETGLIRYQYGEGKFKNRKVGEIPGYLESRFSLDEKDGYLRVVTTNYNNVKSTTENGLYILNKKMEVTGSVRGLAKDERIYSARFLDDIAYFVTYRETDPLFSVDVSDPKNPKVLGKLKIPGFSEYLQFYSENLLFGIGEQDGEVKISMFDVSDPTDVKETDKQILSDYTWSEAWEDSHAVLIDSNKNIIAFPASDGIQTGYLVYTYEPGRGFVKKYTEKTYSDEIDFYHEKYRGVYDKNHLYIIGNGTQISVVDLNKYTKVGEYKLY